MNIVRYENETILPKVGADCLAKTRPVFVSNGEPNDLRACGTCFFIQYLNRFFLVTAAHVAFEKGTLFTRIHGRPGALAPDKINGTFHFIVKPGMQPGRDSADLAFMEMDSSRATLAKESYFSSDEWNEKDVATPESLYLACGWPADLNDPTRIFPDEPQTQEHVAIFNGSLAASAYQAHRIDSTSHYAIEHADQQINRHGHVAQPPKLPGMSGSPLVFVHRYLPEAFGQSRAPKLVGVVIEHDPAGKFIIATRLQVLLGGIRAYIAGSSPLTLFLA